MKTQDNKKEINRRMCVGCRKVQHKSSMIRIVKTPDDEVKIDETSKTSAGRGAYLCKNEQCLKLAQKKHQFEKFFKTKVPAEVYHRLEEMIYNS